MEDKNLNQGRSKRQLDNNARIGGYSFILMVSLLLWAGIFWVCCGCRGTYNTAMHKGYITHPSPHLIAEIPELDLPKPYTIESNKKPKERKINYIMPQYKRITDHYK